MNDSERFHRASNNSSLANAHFSAKSKSTSRLNSNEGVSLSWRNVSVFAPKRRNILKKTIFGVAKCGTATVASTPILRSVYGIAQRSQLLAIMGASGAGKTTLLNTLTGRNLKDVVVDGAVMVNGVNIGSAISSISAYVQQQDLFIGTLTVKEHLVFQACLRLGKQYSDEDRNARVTDVLSELGLLKCQNTLIGIPGRVKGISSGERKRLFIASEILTNPLLLFCDEPTSGLDSFMALHVVELLHNLAKRQGITIVCTIHQPSSQIFKHFDSLCLLAEGRNAYFGEASKASNFFSGLGYALPANYNPADHYIHTLAVTVDKERECRKRIKKICDAFDASSKRILDAKTISLATTKALTTSELSNLDGIDLENQSAAHVTANAWHARILKSSKYKSTWIQQFKALTWRSALCILRDPLLVKVRLTQTIIISLLLGAIYFQTELCCITVQNTNGLLYLFVTNMIFPYVFGTINVFSDEICVFMREHQSSIYRVDTYFIAKNLTELPQYVLYPAIFTTVCYWMVGLGSAADLKTFFTIMGLTILAANVAVAIGYLISTISKNAHIATLVGPIFVLPVMLFGGFYLNQASVPIYFEWLKYLSYFKYTYEALSISYWQHIQVIPACESVNTTTCYTSGHQVLDMLSFPQANFVVDVAVLLAIAFFARLLSFLFLLGRCSF